MLQPSTATATTGGTTNCHGCCIRLGAELESMATHATTTLQRSCNRQCPVLQASLGRKLFLQPAMADFATDDCRVTTFIGGSCATRGGGAATGDCRSCILFYTCAASSFHANERCFFHERAVLGADRLPMSAHVNGLLSMRDGALFSDGRHGVLRQTCRGRRVRSGLDRTTADRRIVRVGCGRPSLWAGRQAQSSRQKSTMYNGHRG